MICFNHFIFWIGRFAPNNEWRNCDEIECVLATEKIPQSLQMCFFLSRLVCFCFEKVRFSFGTCEHRFFFWPTWNAIINVKSMGFLRFLFCWERIRLNLALLNLLLSPLNIIVANESLFYDIYDKNPKTVRQTKKKKYVIYTISWTVIVHEMKNIYKWPIFHRLLSVVYARKIQSRQHLQPLFSATLSLAFPFAKRAKKKTCAI